MENTIYVRANFKGEVEEFWEERPYDTYFKIGNEVPHSAVNLSYFELPSISPENINLIKLFEEDPHDIKTSSVYVPDKNHILHSWPSKTKPYIDTENFILTNLTTRSDNSDGQPFYYKYDLRYFHEHVADNIYDEVTILDSNYNELNASSMGFEISYTDVTPQTGGDEHSIKEVTLKLSETFEQGDYYVNYSPKYNPDSGLRINLPEDYLETINPTALFEEISPKEFRETALRLTDRIYTKEQTAGNIVGHNFTRKYQVRVPHRATKDTEFEGGPKKGSITFNPTDDKVIQGRFETIKTEDEFNTQYTTGRPELFDFRVYASGNVTGQGLLCYILYDHSKALTESVNGQNGFEKVNEEIIDAMDKIDEAIEGEVLFNILYYTNMRAYDNDFIEEEIEKDIEQATSRNIITSPALNYLQDTDILIGEEECFQTESERLVGPNLFIWEGGDSELYSKEALIRSGRKEDGLWGGVTADNIENHANNMFAAYRYAIDNMAYHRNTENHFRKDAAIITLTSTYDNGSKEKDIEYVTSKNGIDQAKGNNITTFSLGWNEFEDYGLPKKEELEYITTEGEEHIFTDTSIARLFDNGTDEMVDEQTVLSKVYLPLYPSSKSFYRKYKEELPWATEWVKNKERVVVDSIKYPDGKLNDVKIHLDSRYNKGNIRNDILDQKTIFNDKNTCPSCSLHTKNKEPIPKLFAEKNDKNLNSISPPYEETEKIIGETDCFETDRERTLGDRMCFDTADETCVESIGFLINDRERHLDHYNPDEHIGTVTLPEKTTRRDRISVIANGDCTKELNSRKYFIKRDRRKNRIDVRLKDEGVNKRWYLQVHNSSFAETSQRIDPYSESGYKYVKNVYVTSPDYYELRKDSIETISEKSPELIDGNTVNLNKKNLVIDDLRSDPDDPSLITPSEEYIKVSTDNKIIDWNENKGIIEFQGPVSDDLEVEYTYENWWLDYKGFYYPEDDEKSSFVPLDLNPRKGHISGRMTNHGVEYIDGSELAGEVVYLYIRPYYIQEKIDGKFIDIPGTKRGNLLFHTIGEKLKNLNYPLFDRATDDLVKLDNIKLLAKVYIQAVSDIENMVDIDTRTRGGGAFPGKLDELKEVFPEVNYYWDTASWNGKAYPSNAVIVIEIPQEVKEYLSEEEIKNKVDKHLALGIVPIIKYV